MTAGFRCPYCWQDPGDLYARKQTEEIVTWIGLESSMADPGGREVIFLDGSRLRLSEFCNVCDLRKVKTFARELGVPSSVLDQFEGRAAWARLRDSVLEAIEPLVARLDRLLGRFRAS